ncbi:MAG: hypothetical protein ABIQ18_39380 [Umezawaea sp.]
MCTTGSVEICRSSANQPIPTSTISAPTRLSGSRSAAATPAARYSPPTAAEYRVVVDSACRSASVSTRTAAPNTAPRTASTQTARGLAGDVGSAVVTPGDRSGTHRRYVRRPVNGHSLKLPH